MVITVKITTKKVNSIEDFGKKKNAKTWKAKKIM